MSGLIDIWTVEFAKLREKTGKVDEPLGVAAKSSNSTHVGDTAVSSSAGMPLNVIHKFLHRFQSNYSDSTISRVMECCFSP